MNIRYLKLLAASLPFLVLLEGCSFYARLGAVKQSEQANAEVYKEKGGDVSRFENSQNQMVLANRR